VFRLFAQEIDYPSDEWTPDAQPSQDSFVFQKNLILTSQTNISPSIQSRRSLALGFLGAISGDLNPATPDTRTDVSTTPLGRFLFCAGSDGDLRQLLSSRAVLANGF
jgi:hypothetical protein